MNPEDKGIKKKEEEKLSKRIDTMFEGIRHIEREMERAFTRPWAPFEMRFPQLPFAALPEVRIPLCDLVDRGDRYELSVEVPGIEKEKIDIKASRHSVEVSGRQSEKREEKGRNYLYNERSYKSFYRKVPVPEEIVPAKIEAKVVNGILNVSIPKKTPKTEGETKVEVK